MPQNGYKSPLGNAPNPYEQSALRRRGRGHDEFYREGPASTYDPQKGNLIAESLRSHAADMGTWVPGMRVLYNEAVGDKEASAAAAETYARRAARAQEIGPEIQSLEDVKAAGGGVGNYLAYGLHEGIGLIPDIAASLTGAGAGAAIGGRVAKNAVKGQMRRRLADNPITKEFAEGAEHAATRRALLGAKDGAKGAADALRAGQATGREVADKALNRQMNGLIRSGRVGKDTIGAATKAGAATGLVAGQFPAMNTGNMDMLTREENTQGDAAKMALATTAASVIGALPLGRFISGFGKKAQQEVLEKTPGFFKRVGKETAIQGVSEGSTEAVQEAVQLAGHKWVDENIDLLSPEAVQTYALSFVVGGVAGGAMGGGAEVGRSAYRGAKRLPSYLVEKASGRLRAYKEWRGNRNQPPGTPVGPDGQPEDGGTPGAAAAPPAGAGSTARDGVRDAFTKAKAGVTDLYNKHLKGLQWDEEVVGETANVESLVSQLMDDYDNGAPAPADIQNPRRRVAHLPTKMQRLMMGAVGADHPVWDNPGEVKASAASLEALIDAVASGKEPTAEDMARVDALVAGGLDQGRLNSFIALGPEIKVAVARVEQSARERDTRFDGESVETGTVARERETGDGEMIDADGEVITGLGDIEGDFNSGMSEGDARDVLDKPQPLDRAIAARRGLQTIRERIAALNANAAEARDTGATAAHRDALQPLLDERARLRQDYKEARAEAKSAIFDGSNIVFEEFRGKAGDQFRQRLADPGYVLLKDTRVHPQYGERRLQLDLGTLLKRHQARAREAGVDPAKDTPIAALSRGLAEVVLAGGRVDPSTFTPGDMWAYKGRGDARKRSHILMTLTEADVKQLQKAVKPKGDPQEGPVTQAVDLERKARRADVDPETDPRNREWGIVEQDEALQGEHKIDSGEDHERHVLRPRAVPPGSPDLAARDGSIVPTQSPIVDAFDGNQPHKKIVDAVQKQLSPAKTREPTKKGSLGKAKDDSAKLSPAERRAIKHDAGVEIGTLELERQVAAGDMTQRQAVQIAGRIADPETGMAVRIYDAAAAGAFDVGGAAHLVMDSERASGSDGPFRLDSEGRYGFENYAEPDKAGVRQGLAAERVIKTPGGGGTQRDLTEQKKATRAREARTIRLPDGSTYTRPAWKPYSSDVAEAVAAGKQERKTAVARVMASLPLRAEDAAQVNNVVQAIQGYKAALGAIQADQTGRPADPGASATPAQRAAYDAAATAWAQDKKARVDALRQGGLEPFMPAETQGAAPAGGSATAAAFANARGARETIATKAAVGTAKGARLIAPVRLTRLLKDSTLSLAGLAEAVMAPTEAKVKAGQAAEGARRTAEKQAAEAAEAEAAAPAAAKVAAKVAARAASPEGKAAAQAAKAAKAARQAARAEQAEANEAVSPRGQRAAKLKARQEAKVRARATAKAQRAAVLEQAAQSRKDAAARSKRTKAKADTGVQFDEDIDGAGGAKQDGEIHHNKMTQMANAILERLGITTRVTVRRMTGDTTLHAGGSYQRATGVIEVNPNLKGAELIEVVLHEVGHHVVWDRIASALGIDVTATAEVSERDAIRAMRKHNRPLYNALRKDYAKWLATANTSRHVLDVRAMRSPMHRVMGLTSRAMGRRGAALENMHPASRQRLFNAHEWLADNIAKSLAARQASQTVVGKFFKAIADRMKLAYRAVKKDPALRKYLAAKSVDRWVADMFNSDRIVVGEVLQQPVSMATAADSIESAVRVEMGDRTPKTFRAMVRFVRAVLRPAERKILEDFLDRGATTQRLHAYYAGNEGAQRAMADAQNGMEYRIALAYLAWKDGGFKLGAQTGGIIGKIDGWIDKLRKSLDLSNPSSMAEQIFTDIASGRVQRIVDARGADGYDVEARAARSKGDLQKVLNATADAAERITEPLSKAFDGTVRRLWSSGVPALRKVAALIRPKVGTTGRDYGMSLTILNKVAYFAGKLNDSMEGLSARQQHKVISLLQRQGKGVDLASVPAPIAKAYRDVRAVLDETHAYMVESGVEIGKRENYFQVMLDMRNDKAREDLTNLLQGYEAEIREFFGTLEAADVAAERTTREHLAEINKGLKPPPAADNEIRWMNTMAEKIEKKRAGSKLARSLKAAATAMEQGNVGALLSSIGIAIQRRAKVAENPKVYDVINRQIRMMEDRLRELAEAGFVTQLDLSAPGAPRVERLRIPAGEDQDIGVLIKNLVDGAASETGMPATTGSNAPNFRGANRRLMQFIYDRGDIDDIRKFVRLQSKDAHEVFARYVEPAVKRAEYARRFGDDGAKLAAMLKEAEQQGATEAQIQEARHAVEAALSVYGNDVSPTIAGLSEGLAKRLSGKKTRAFVQGVQAYENARVLPLALLSSLVDPMGIAVHTGGDFKTAWQGVKAGMKAIGNKASRAELEDLLRSIDVAEDMTVMHTLHTKFGGGGGKFSRAVNERVFRYNGMAAWVKLTRAQALVTGHLWFIKMATTNPQDHGADAYNKATRHLAELGLRREDITDIDPLVRHDGTILQRVKLLSDAELAAATPAERRRDERVRNGLRRFVDNSILRPTSSQSPLWHSDPYMGMFSQYKAFAYAFFDQIGGKIGHEIKHGNINVLIPALAYAPFAVLAELLRELIQWGGEGNPNRAEWGPDDYLMLGVERTGLLGPRVQTSLDIKDDFDRNQLPGTSQIGPAPSQLRGVSKAIHGHRDRGKTFEEALPASSLWRQWNNLPDENIPDERREAA